MANAPRSLGATPNQATKSMRLVPTRCYNDQPGKY